ncbi:MAG: chemotaxis protein CheA [Clostridiaceae bacterium]|jgi:two-component system chemotaxis sensor kinase CheA|nr:chemotaxis protein CheA [Clostridiaceae bacterium]
MDASQYLDVFIDEAKENMQSLNTSLLELESDPTNTSILNEIFRVAHTLKGMAGTMGFSRMTALTHHMEDVLDGLRNNRLKAGSNIVDILFKCLDALESYVNEVIASGQEGEEEYQDIIASLSDILKGEADGQTENKQKDFQPAKDGRTASGLRLKLNIYDRNVIEKAMEEGLNVYEIHIEIDKKCLLKAARAFIIFQLLDKSSEIMKSMPPVEDIEDEKFDYYFTVMVITKHNRDYFIKELNSVAEVRKVEVTPITLKHVENIKPGAVTHDVSDTDRIKAADREQIKTSAPKPGAIKRLTTKTVRVDIERLDVLMNLVSELIIIKTRLADIGVSDRSSDYVTTVENLERVTTRLHDAVMKARMVPIENVFSRFPRMVRDISRELQKEIELHMSGEETELDRTVIDEIGEPLIHIIRNSADHGLEKPDVRVEKGKNKCGNIWLKAYQDGNNVVIEVEDDGQGIDIEKVRRRIVERGLESEEVAAGLSDSDIIKYLFAPNFSTADKITDLSGRGVGLDVVKTKIESLGGAIEIETEQGKGSRVIIRLPLTLAIIQALLVRIGTEKFAIPLSNIREITKIEASDIQFVRDREVYFLRDSVIPVVRLGEVLKVPESGDTGETKKQLTCVVVRKGDKFSGFIVDSLIGQKEIVIKSLGRLLANIRHIAGATILGDGNVALIIDVNSIV